LLARIGLSPTTTTSGSYASWAKSASHPTAAIDLHIFKRHIPRRSVGRDLLTRHRPSIHNQFHLHIPRIANPPPPPDSTSPLRKPRRSCGFVEAFSGNIAATFAVALIFDALASLISLPFSPTFKSFTLKSIR